MSNYTTITNCRVCNSPRLKEILPLGSQQVVGFNKGGTKMPEAPLTIVLCKNCYLLQLKDTTNPDLLWGGDYWYRSGINQTMKLELSSITREVSRMIELKRGDMVLDIGANDGTLLSSYKEKGLIRVGFDPAKNLIPYFNKTMKEYGGLCHLFSEYFNPDAFINRYGKLKAKVITAIAMFYDLDDPNKFIKGIKKILDRKGVFVIQQNYLLDMLRNNAFDNICHEHLEYYSLLSLENLLKRHGLEVFSVSKNNINGGSFRTLIGFGGYHRIEPSVAHMRAAERRYGLHTTDKYNEFARRVIKNGQKLVLLLRELKGKGEKIYIYGASTRGNTLLQFYGIDARLIDGAAERNPDKWGLQIASIGTLIYSEEESRKVADTFLVLPYHFRKEFIEREQDFVNKGGKMIFPLPKLEIYR